MAAWRILWLCENVVTVKNFGSSRQKFSTDTGMVTFLNSKISGICVCRNYTVPGLHLVRHKDSALSIRHHQHYSTRASSRKFPTKDLYSVLDVSPFATQSQIKASYYKLSMKYHPDQNQGNMTAQELFKQITDAYSILGKASSRRSYDKGLLKDYPVPQHVKEVKHRRASTASNASPKVYDFDAFDKGHYGEILRRSWDFQKRKKAERKVIVRGLTTNNSNNMFVVPSVLIFILWCSYYLN